MSASAEVLLKEVVMSVRNLLLDPIWQAQELGRSIPDSLHAVSVALPRWQDVVGYEEKWPEVVSRLQNGYPRFVIHQLVQELAGRFGGGRPCLPFPSARVARLCADFVQSQSGEVAEVVAGEGAYVVVTGAAGWDALKAFWQHTGLIVSTRQAAAILAGQKGCGDLTEVRGSLRRQLADLYGCAEDDVFLQPTGMAAQFAGLRAVL
jgi:cystathionine gamma-synthase